MSVRATGPGLHCGALTPWLVYTLGEREGKINLHICILMFDLFPIIKNTPPRAIMLLVSRSIARVQRSSHTSTRKLPRASHDRGGAFAGERSLSEGNGMGRTRAGDRPEGSFRDDRLHTHRSVPRCGAIRGSARPDGGDAASGDGQRGL